MTVTICTSITTGTFLCSAALNYNLDEDNLTKLSNAMAGNNGGLDRSKTLDLCATEKVCVPSDSLCGVCK